MKANPITINVASAIAVAMLLAGCNAKAPPDSSAAQTDTPLAQGGENQTGAAATGDYSAPAQLPVVSVYVDPPLAQPEPIRVDWAPPPMLVDMPTPQPSEDQVWTGGYWVWEGNWVWARGNWSPPPRPGYRWNNPYYDHRGNAVIFVDGYWAAPGVNFVAPSVNVDIAMAVIGIGVIAGIRPHGPEGVFVPAPPGSYYGLIVPAPPGTAPAVVMGSAPLVRDGMRVTVNNNTTTTTNITNVTNVTNLSNVTVTAPANAMANGKAVNASVPALPHLAASQTSLVNARAPDPSSRQHVASYVAGHQPISLPPAQVVHAFVPPALSQQHASIPAEGPVKATSQSTVTPPLGVDQKESDRRDDPRTRAPVSPQSRPPVAQVPPAAKPMSHPEPAVVNEIPPIPKEQAIKPEPAEPARHVDAIAKKNEPTAEPRTENKPQASRQVSKPQNKPEKKAEDKQPEKPEHE